ncbi:MAG TPA: PAS domain-containing protein [Actinomycetospora sp.]|jgi:hypothetical protein|uniref:PAS domain-containing protein n=1 Tax=Actinomycetospora sp. TaxID=1872135 RepID=UPI002F400301
MSAERNGEFPSWSRHEDIRIDVVEALVRDIHAGSLDRVMKVSLRLMALASFADPPGREMLLAQVDQLDAAVRNVRDVFFREHGTSVAEIEAAPEEGRVELALLDRDGVIVWTNRAWDDFCRHNGGDPRRAGVGRSYLAVCEAAGDQPGSDLARSVHAAVRGGLPVPARTVVSCPAPGRPRAFDTLVSTRYDDDGRTQGALVSLSEVGVVDAFR